MLVSETPWFDEHQRAELISAAGEDFHAEDGESFDSAMEGARFIRDVTARGTPGAKDPRWADEVPLASVNQHE